MKFSSPTIGKTSAVLALILAGLLTANAQSPTPATAPGANANPTGETPAAGAFWACDLPGGRYVVALRAITSVSEHEYLIDNAAHVTETNIATTGSEIARFYFVEPMVPTVPTSGGQAALEKLQQAVRDISTQTGQSGALEEVIKSYPTSTHAHTVEYRLHSKDEAGQILSSVEKAWRTGRGVNLKIGGS